jgi:predicted transcriptional regulator
MDSVQKIISQVMSHYGFRHKYQVAKYFGVSPQALSTWLTTGKIPSRHILKVRSEIQESELPEPTGSSIEENKTVIDYLINENVRLKNKIAKLNANIYNIQSE